MTMPARSIPKCSPRRSGLSRLQLVLLGKGPYQALKPMTAREADAWADRRDAKANS